MFSRLWNWARKLRDRIREQRAQRDHKMWDSIVPQAMKPRDLGLKIITEGNLKHKHVWEEVPWDRERLGASMVDKDDVKSNQFAMATYRTLYRCDCTAEGIHENRSLI